MFRNTVAPKQTIYGEAVVSRPILFQGVSGVTNKYLHLVIALAGHEIGAINDVWFGDKLAAEWDEFGTKKKVTIATYYKITRHLDTENQAADPDLIAAFPDKWSASHRLRGIAYLHVKIQWSPDLWPFGVPNIKALVKGKTVYDPRNGQTVWSNNWGCVRGILSSIQWAAMSMIIR